MFPACAQDLPYRAPVEPEIALVVPAPTTDKMVALARRRIEAYLLEKFCARRISPDLLRIVMARIDSFIAGVRIPEAEEAHPATTSYPSVALQIVWQDALEDIASDFEHDFVMLPRPLPPHPIIEGAPRVPPNVNSVTWFAANAIVEAQGHISEELREHPLPSDFRFGKRPSNPRTSLGRYAAPVRIAPTKIALVDQMLPWTLAEIRADHPDSMISEASFPATPAAANLIIPEQRYGGYGRWKVLACAREIYCRSFGDFVRYRTPDDPTYSAKDRLAFLDSIYLTNPYGERNGITAVVQIGRDGAIVSSYCSVDDIRYSASLIGAPPLRSENLRACLEQAMGY